MRELIKDSELAVGKATIETDGDLAPDDIVNSLRDIILAAELLTESLHRRLQCADGHGMTLFALRSISAAGRRGLSQVELARQTHISSSATTRLIDGLEKGGVVSRLPHPTDRRLKMIVMTPAGQSLVDQIVADLAGPGSPLRLMSRETMNSFRSQLSSTATIASRLL